MSPFERALLWAATALVAVSGVLLGAMKYLVSPADPFAVVNHPWQPAVLKAHVLVAPLLVFAVGTVFTRHVWPRFLAGEPAGRRSGMVLVAAFGVMTTSGYLVQTVTHRGWLLGVVVAHLATGLGFTLAFAGHQFAATARERRAPRRGAADRVLDCPSCSGDCGPTHVPIAAPTPSASPSSSPPAS